MTNAQPDESLSNDAGETDACAPAVVALIPPRYRWLKFFLKLGGFLVVALWVLRLWWGWEANRRLQAQIQGYRDAGQLVYAEEFDALLDAVPDEQNAALLYEKAFTKIVAATASGVTFQEFSDEGKYFLKQHMAEAEELIRLNQPVFELVHKALTKPQVAWSMRLRGIAAFGIVGPWSSQRQLAKLLAFRATYQFQTGDHNGAIETLLDFERYNQAIVDHPVIIADLVGWACFSMSYRTIEEYAAQLSVANRGQFGGTLETPARREDIERLVSALFAEEPLRRSAAATYLGERATTLDQLGFLRDYGVFSSRVSLRRPISFVGQALDWCWRPAAVLDIGRQSKMSTIAALAIDQPNSPAALALLPVQTQKDDVIRVLSRPITEYAGGSAIQIYARCTYGLNRLLAQRRMAATSLAIHVYSVDFGHRPKELADLVPQYLQAVPLDPLAADETAIRYKPDAEPALLYSVGVDGLDNNGTSRWDREANTQRDGYDELFYLDGRPLPDFGEEEPESTQAGDEDESGDKKERNAEENDKPQD